MKKKIIEKETPVVETEVKETEVVETPVKEKEVIETSKPAVQVVSAEKLAFKKLIENYKIGNPVKYEGKKEALEKRLNEIK